MSKEKVKECFNKLVNQKTKYKEVPEFFPDGKYEGIKAITYDGLLIDGKKTKVFAYLGMPKSCGEKSKAIVLVHGGGGHAFLEWVKMWNDRGYVAIAMNTVGGFPTIKNAWVTETGKDKDEYELKLNGVFAEDGYVEVPSTEYMATPNESLEKQAFTHAIASFILGANIIFDLPNVDKSKVGITGISWGGVITTAVLGFDDRFAFAIPTYGSAFLGESYADMWLNVYKHEKNRDLWSLENYLCGCKIPILWLCWNDDSCFSINSNSKSYLLTEKNNSKTLLSIVDKMYHSHIDGWARPEIYAYAESIINNGFSLTRIKGDYANRKVVLDLEVDKKVDKTKIQAKIYYITSKIKYCSRIKYIYQKPLKFMEQDWLTKDLSCDGSRVKGGIPVDAYSYYIEVKTVHDGKEYVTTTPVINF